ncbi:MAG: sigma-70 family RNA polymerase sigma factor [Kiritimatiellia bacterium]
MTSKASKNNDEGRSASRFCPDRERANALALRVQRGDKEAFDELITLFQRPVFNLVYRLLSHYGAADDATQEVFIKVYRTINRFRGDSSFATWLYRIAVNTALNHLRTLKRRSSFEVEGDAAANDCADGVAGLAAASGPSPSEEAERAEIRHAVGLVVAGLPPVYATVLVLKDVQGLKYEEIAAVLRCSVGTVKSRLARGRNMAKEKLTRLLRCR